VQRRYVILDVFTRQKFAGNPLAVVLDGAGLNDVLMQKIAGEFNLSETVFVTSVDQQNKSAKIRIFTPLHELPFAGHPTVGTATLLAREYFAGEADINITLEEEIGPVQCRVNIGEDTSYSQFTMPQLPECVGECGPIEIIADALGLSVSDIGFDGHKPQQWSGGVPYSLIPVSSIEAVRKIEPNGAIWAKAFGEGHHNNAFVYCRECDDASHQYHARMFWPGAGVREDPATGSAVAAFAGIVQQNDSLADGSHRIVIEQGYEMGRPSLIALSLEIREGSIAHAMIGGNVVEFARGIIRVRTH